MLFNTLRDFHWNWTDFCPTGIRPFSLDSNDLQPCFQEIVLQLPAYTLFAALSAYYCGAYNQPVIARNSTQRRLIYGRIICSLLLAALPVMKLFVFHTADVELHASDVLVVCTECVMWVVHCGYLLSSRNSGLTSHRGPIIMSVLWLVIFLLDGIWLRTSIHFSWWTWSLATFLLDVTYGIMLIPGGSAVVNVPRYEPDQEQESLVANRYTHFHFDFNETHLGHAQDEAPALSRFVFHWVDALIAKGVAGGLKKIEDLFDLPDSLNIARLSERLHMRLSRASTVFRALHKAYGKEFYAIGLLRFIADISNFAGPLLLGALLIQGQNSNLTEDEESNEINPKAYLYALGLFSTTLLSAFCSTHFNWRMSMIGMKMRVGVVSAIYRKTLEARGLRDSRPEVLNLMSTDTDRIVNSCISFHSFWSIPFQLFTTLFLLYTQLGAAFIAGLAFAITLIPINRWLANRIGIYSQGLMSTKDARLAAISEAVSGAKQIKLYSWEDIFIEKIRRLRSAEVDYLAKRKYLDAMCVYFWATTPVLMCFLTFGVSVLMGNPLTAATTYTSVALLNMLIGPLNAFPWVLNGLIEAWVSVKRVQELINLDNLDFSTYYNPIVKSSDQPVDDPPVVLQMKDASFEYDANEASENTQEVFRLQNVNLEVKKGELVCLEGPVGGGKTTLIAAIVADVKTTGGYVRIHDITSGFGYVPQTPWLQRGTIRDNILWGAAFDEQWYKAVLYACALVEDIHELGGDQVGVGENGRTLSGGQRARVALARAVYQDKKIYLLDDILASVDAHVANHIIKHCLLGLLKKKTRIVVTRNPRVLFAANQIFHVDNGRVTKSEYMNESIEYSYDDDTEDEDAGMQAKRPSVDLSDEQDKKSVDSVMLEESREYGYLSMGVFSCYWKAITSSLASTVLLFVLLMQLSRSIYDLWLAHWVQATTLDPHNNDTALQHVVVVERDWPHAAAGNGSDPADEHTVGYYLGVFAALALTNSVMTLARAFLFAYAGIKAARRVHDMLLNRVMFTKFQFFDITSVGRILNRFSSDTYTVDDSLPFILNILLAQVFGLAGAIFITLYAMPWLILVVLPLVPIYYNLQHRYRHASRDIKRLSSNALSPLYTHFTETLQGLVTIRTMRASARFQRDFHGKLEESIKAQLTASAAQQWLGLRIQLLGAVLVGGAGMLAALTSAHATDPGMVGLAIATTLSITGLLGGVLNATAETEQELVAVERVEQYLRLEPEENVNGTQEAPFGWPTQGVLTLENVRLSYREHLTPALRDVSLRTEAFERVAIVGRTGAGKTSLVAALFRVAPLLRGEIMLDCVNLRSLPLKVLRDRIGIIPQEAFLFEGSVRENLDPRSAYYDSEIWSAIKCSAAATHLVQSLGGLDGFIDRGGINLSAGQKQLICLTRAILKNNKVVCIDEGTSNLDDETEVAMQQALRNSFKSSTILYIAHRLRGLQSMDRVIVMDHGEIKEQGAPRALAADAKSLFHEMLQTQHINVAEFCSGVPSNDKTA